MVLFSKSMNHFKDQHYKKLRKTYQKMGGVFMDPLFPTTQASLVYSKELQGKVEWKRPGELCETPRLFVGGASAQDVTQGQLGNCWFVAACSSLAGVKELWNKVIPDYKDQEWDPDHPEKYAGIFHFRFWRFGEWTDVVVDDLLPTINGQLIFTHSNTKNEFWSALLEKAYAKLHGCYECLDGGNLTDALVDFTSGVSEVVNLIDGGYVDDGNKTRGLFKSMLKKKEDHSLMCCAVAPASAEEMETRTEAGLVKGHAYGITAVKEVNLGNTSLLSFFKGRDKLYMVRLRNPWGEQEWKGAFSDGSPEWSRVSETERERIGLTFDDDGEFWMTFEDFVKNFTDLSICHLFNTSHFSFRKTWQEVLVKGHWTDGLKGTSTDRAGGCPNHPETFLRNPQYRFDIFNDEDEVIIELMQKDVRDKRQDGIENLIIGFQIMKVEDNRLYRMHIPQQKVAISDYIRTRSIFYHGTLDKGRYVVVPTTFAPGETGSYLLRFYSGSNAYFKHLKCDFPKHSIMPCISYPVCVTQLTVKGATGLERNDTFGNTADPYCYIKCERKVVRGTFDKATLIPNWNTKAIFFRKKMHLPIRIQVWDSNLIKDYFMGQIFLPAPLNNKMETVTMELKGRGRHSEESRPGSITVEFQTEEDMVYF